MVDGFPADDIGERERSSIDEEIFEGRFELINVMEVALPHTWVDLSFFILSFAFLLAMFGDIWMC